MSDTVTEPIDLDLEMKKQNAVAVLPSGILSIEDYLVLKRLDYWNKKGYKPILVIDNVRTKGIVSAPLYDYIQRIVDSCTIHFLTDVTHQEIGTIETLLELTKLVRRKESNDYVFDDIHAVIAAYSATYFDANVFIDTMSLGLTFIHDVNPRITRSLRIDGFQYDMDICTNSLTNSCLFKTNAEQIYRTILSVHPKTIKRWCIYSGISSAEDQRRLFAYTLIKEVFDVEVADRIVNSYSIPTYIIPEEPTTVWNTLIKAGLVLVDEEEEKADLIFLNGERVRSSSRINLSNRDNVLRYKNNVRVLI
jgi:hypothetical protein